MDLDVVYTFFDMNRYYAGWDGGGTSTVIECIDENGNTLLRAEAGPFNSAGNESTLYKTVADSLAYMAGLNGGLKNCGGLCIGGAGISSEAVRAGLKNALKENNFTAPYQLAADYETAFYGAFKDEPGIILISGTGSVCYGQNANGKNHRAGGWGHIIDDGGSGYAIARDVLSAVVQSLDGRIPHTVLIEEIFERLNINEISKLITYIHNATGKKEIAALAPLCFKSASVGDITAKNIINKAAADLFKLIEAVARALQLNHFPLALHGSTLIKGIALREGLLNLLESSSYDFTIHEDNTNAARGAAFMARVMFRM
jgi:N-acetylglucosamine kinase-like BadF-type ATPase